VVNPLSLMPKYIAFLLSPFESQKLSQQLTLCIPFARRVTLSATVSVKTMVRLMRVEAAVVVGSRLVLSLFVCIRFFFLQSLFWVIRLLFCSNSEFRIHDLSFYNY